MPLKFPGAPKAVWALAFLTRSPKPMYAEVEDDAKNKREIQTGPLTNYNILVFDQTLKNNSSISFINTNVMRNGSDYDANVSAFVFDINNKKNTYGLNGNASVSNVTNPTGKNKVGYAHMVSFQKTSGNLLFTLQQDLYDDKYDINDMGILFNNNYIDHYFWTGYRMFKTKSWYNRIQLNFNATYSQRFKPSDYQVFYTNVNANVQFKNLWWAGVFVGLNAQGNDFYEPRAARSFLPGRRNRGGLMYG